MGKKQYLRIDKGDLPDQFKRYPQDTKNKPQFYALIEKEYENYYDLCFSEDVTLDDLKIISYPFKECVFHIEGEIGWNEARGFAYFGNNKKGLSVGKVFRIPYKDTYHTSKAIGIVLTTNPNDRIYTADYNIITGDNKDKSLNQYFEKSLYRGKTDNADNDSLKKDVSEFSATKQEDNNSVISTQVTISTANQGTTNIIELPVQVPGQEGSSELKQMQESPLTPVHGNANNDVSVILDVLSFDSVQYLLPGREGETFFYEGSENDSTGAFFKIEYERKSMKGQFDIIVDINNLRTMNSGFRRGVIKIAQSGTTIREATGFIKVSKGEAHFSKQDGVWMVDKPLVIKLFK